MTVEQIERYGAEVIRFGDWIVTENGIYWSKEKPRNLFIGQEELGSSITVGTDRLYDMLIHLSGRTWLAELEMYQLNTAYFFAVDYFNVDRLSDSATLIHQREMFEERRDFDDSEEQEMTM